MPSPIPSPIQNRKTFGQLAGDMMTRGEFRDAFRKAVALIRTGREQLDARITSALQSIEQSLTSKIDARLALIKDGKPGAKGDKGDTVAGPMGPAGPAGQSIIGPMGPAPKALDPKEVARLTLPEVFAEIDRRIPLLGDALRFGMEQYAKDYLSKLDYGGGAVLAVMQSGTLKVQQANTLNFKGAGAPTVTTGVNGVTHLDFPSGNLPTIRSEVLTDSGDHKNFTAAHTINSVLSLQDGSGKGIPLKDASGATNYTFSGTTLTLASADANLATIGLNLIYA